MKRIGLFLILLGGITLGWSGYSIMAQSESADYEPEQTRQDHTGWDNQEKQASINLETNGDAVKVQKPQEKQKHTPKKEPEKAPDVGEKVGQLAIPRIGYQYDIFWGTGEDTLKQGVGLHDSKWTVTPDRQGHVVLSGHRDTVFNKLRDVTEGDYLYVTYDGTVYEYQIRKIWITDRKDRSVIVSKNKPTLTLTTCYPFDFIGPAPDRYIVESELVSKKEK
ncbi:class D sortase [Thalassobacillus sp. CUG 92003]|uniref:class D sortase n=1 Tax=Thalassobacillus sp. CUG 92003 TaxID=2736641 RepID=UPI0015E6D4A5|nr:class D sortase [Thalassobacillus sp. CUG 92003]